MATSCDLWQAFFFWSQWLTQYPDVMVWFLSPQRLNVIEPFLWMLDNLNGRGWSCPGNAQWSWNYGSLARYQRGSGLFLVEPLYQGSGHTLNAVRWNLARSIYIVWILRDFCWSSLLQNFLYWPERPDLSSEVELSSHQGGVHTSNAVRWNFGVSTLLGFWGISASHFFYNFFCIDQSRQIYSQNLGLNGSMGQRGQRLTFNVYHPALTYYFEISSLSFWLIDPAC